MSTVQIKLHHNDYSLPSPEKDYAVTMQDTKAYGKVDSLFEPEKKKKKVLCSFFFFFLAIPKKGGHKNCKAIQIMPKTLIYI